MLLVTTQWGRELLKSTAFPGEEKGDPGLWVWSERAEDPGLTLEGEAPWPQ